MIVQYPDGNFRFRVLHHFLSWFRQQKKNLKKKTNFQPQIDGNFHFRILGMTSVPDFR